MSLTGKPLSDIATKATPEDTDEAVIIDRSVVGGAGWAAKRITFSSIKSWLSTVFASALQGEKADSAVQPGDLSDVATTGEYGDLQGKPIFGSAAFDESSSFATAVQGSKADSAVQPGDLAAVATSGLYADLANKPTLGTAAPKDVGVVANTVMAGDDARVTLPPGHLPQVVRAGTTAITAAEMATYANKHILMTGYTTGGSISLDVSLLTSGQRFEMSFPNLVSGQILLYSTVGEMQTPRLSRGEFISMIKLGTLLVQYMFMRPMLDNNGAQWLDIKSGVKFAMVTPTGGGAAWELNFGAGGLEIASSSNAQYYARVTSDSVANPTVWKYCWPSFRLTYQAYSTSDWNNSFEIKISSRHNTVGSVFANMPSGLSGKDFVTFDFSGAGTLSTSTAHVGHMIFGRSSAPSGAPVKVGYHGMMSGQGGLIWNGHTGNSSAQVDTSSTGTITATEYTASVLLNSSTAASSVTINFPQTPENGQEWSVLVGTANYTGITLAAGAAARTIKGPTSVGLTMGSSIKYRYNSTTNAWWCVSYCVAP